MPYTSLQTLGRLAARGNWKRFSSPYPVSSAATPSKTNKTSHRPRPSTSPCSESKYGLLTPPSSTDSSSLPSSPPKSTSRREQTCRLRVRRQKGKIRGRGEKRAGNRETCIVVFERVEVVDGMERRCVKGTKVGRKRTMRRKRRESCGAGSAGMGLSGWKKADMCCGGNGHDGSHSCGGRDGCEICGMFVDIWIDDLERAVPDLRI